MQWLVLIGMGIIFLISWIVNAVSEAATRSAANRKHRLDLETERNKKYGDRQTDITLSLFERNRDIIEKFANSYAQGSTGYSRYRYYELDNEVRDCINEICLAENRHDVRPNSMYLSNWRATAPKEWLELSKQIETNFKDTKEEKEERARQAQLVAQETERRKRQLEEEIARVREDLEYRQAKRVDPISVQRVDKRHERGSLLIEQMTDILTPNARPWSEKEKELMTLHDTASSFPLFEDATDSRTAQELNKEINDFNAQLELDREGHQKNSEYFKQTYKGYKAGEKANVVDRINYILEDIAVPRSIPKFWNANFDPEEGIAIVEIKLPDVVHNDVLKEVQLKSGKVKKPLNNKEKKELVPNFHPAQMLRTAYEIFRNDTENVIKLLVVNGWVEYNDPTTGNTTKTYTASLAASKEQIIGLHLTKLDPLAAFMNLKGKSAGKLIDIIPITPVLSLDRKDKRFIDTKKVLESLGKETNLAAMAWQDFESLIAELFAKEFAKEGAEVKVTQASRDRGVDAIVFDPDAIKGGKFIVQAKRYTNTVDVSAVRDLCAVVKKEGASKGILVTTSAYGSDAYAFAQNEPVTLLNGAELLGLLEKHGYKFRINIKEARKLNNAK